jgi:hypothetical protein
MSLKDSSTVDRPANRLIHESSPYLRQHAHNPVDWYPWGEEALRAAREQDKPIFLSIGYSACHWCHVMEHESFENDAIAALMNQYFINIKVDREERPDLDQIYMNAVQLMTRSGGWPMSVFLTPDLQPFFGGTYWPPENRWGKPGFPFILQKVDEAWREKREHVLKGAEEMTAAVRQMAAAESDPLELSDHLLKQAMDELLQQADRRYGGFGSVPKFPHAMDLRVLLRCWQRFGEADALAVVQLTLDRMSHGGIYDHLGGGFHRYSTDERWLAPHFEKMLYDNALLVPAYLEGWQATGHDDYLRIVRETLDYVLREMTQPGGGFYSTQDADSEGEEGKFFVWYDAEIEKVLDERDAYLFNYCYDVTPPGNWEGHNILNRVKTHRDAARILDLSEEELQAVLDRCKARLYEVRSRRVNPGRDEKILVSWNGMMLSAMAQAAQVLSEPRYAAAAAETADFILAKLRTSTGELWHCYKDDQPRINGFLDDYACLIDGLVDVYQATFESRFLEAAVSLADKMLSLFHDGDAGGFFYTATTHEQLIARNKETYDGSTPSGNSMAATALLRLGRICGRTDLEEKGLATLQFLSGSIGRSPMSGGQALLALDFFLGPTREIVFVDGSQTTETDAALHALYRHFLPNKLVLRHRGSQSDAALPAVVKPLLSGKHSHAGQPTIYVCEHGTCGLPVTGIEGLEQALVPKL